MKENLNREELSAAISDTRKSFEYKVGTFKRSVNPNVDNFRDFPKYLNKLKKKPQLIKIGVLK